MTPERKAELRAKCDGIFGVVEMRQCVRELLEENAALESDLAEAHGQIDALNVRLEAYVIATAERDRAINSMTAQIASLQRQHKADAARIAGLESEANRRLVDRDARIDEVAMEAQEATRKLEALRVAVNAAIDQMERGVIVTHAFREIRAALKAGDR